MLYMGKSQLVTIFKHTAGHVYVSLELRYLLVNIA